MLEFLKKLYKDSELPFLWHYMPELDSASQKPIPIPPGEDSKPVPLESLFECGEGKAEGKFVLEIGSGKGAFLCQYARQFPENRILGAEWDVSCASFAAKRLARLGIKNAAVMRGDLFYFLKDLAPSASIDEVHMYFPDPWPKRRHQKNRLVLREGFLELLRKALKPGKRLFYWATDHEEYNFLALQAFKGFAHAAVLEENTAQPTYGIETGFEKKYKKEGRKIYRSVIEVRA